MACRDLDAINTNSLGQSGGRYKRIPDRLQVRGRGCAPHSNPSASESRGAQRRVNGIAVVAGIGPKRSLMPYLQKDMTSGLMHGFYTPSPFIDCVFSQSSVFRRACRRGMINCDALGDDQLNSATNACGIVLAQFARRMSVYRPSTLHAGHNNDCGG